MTVKWTKRRVGDLIVYTRTFGRRVAVIYRRASEGMMDVHVYRNRKLLWECARPLTNVEYAKEAARREAAHV